MGEWRVLVAETVTGLIVNEVSPAGPPKFSRRLCDKGTWSVDVVVGARPNQQVDFQSYAESRYSWLIVFDDYIVQGGPCGTPSAKEDTKTVTFSGTGIGGLFARRLVRNPSSIAQQIAGSGADVKYTNLSRRGIMRQLVADNLSRPGYGLPIDLPAAEAGTITRTYNGFDLNWIWDRLVDLSEEDDGPEFDFPARFVDDTHVRWELAIGTPTLGDLNTTAVWDYGGALSTIDVDRNGSAAPSQRAWAKGSGSDHSTLIGFAEDLATIGLGYPAMDFVNTEHSQIEDRAALTALAAADLKQVLSPTETWSCSVRVDGLNSNGKDVSPKLGTWALGDKPRFGVRGHFWIPDGDYRWRIIGYSDATAQTVALELADAPAIR